MDLDQLRAEKSKLEETLRQVLAEEIAFFEEKTGVCITGVSVYSRTLQTVAGPDKFLMEAVKVDIDI